MRCMIIDRKHIAVSILLYLIINELFILKYSLRILPFAGTIICCLIYITFVLCFFYMIRLYNVFSHINTKTAIGGILSIIVLLAFIQWMINPYQLQVDRWSAIHNFLDNLFNGKYPYAAQTHLGGYGSPFPVWHLFHIPFYLLGNVGLSFIIGMGLFFDAIRRLFGFNKALFAVLLLIMSPAYLYEVAVRSDLMTNFLLCAAIIIYLNHYKINFNQHYIFLAVIIGLMASTRLSAVIPFAVYFFYDYMKGGLHRQFVFPILFVSVFILTFLPFLLWDGEMLLFYEYNPFILQSRQGNIIDFVLFIPVGILLSLRWKRDIPQYMFNTACLLILLVVITFVHNMYENNNWNALFDSAYDITYFNMALPFIILSISTNEIYFSKSRF